MAFFNSPVEAFITIAAICTGFGLVLVWREVRHQAQVAQMRMEISLLRSQVAALQDVMLKHFPGDATTLNITGNVSDSVLSAAGRDARANT